MSSREADLEFESRVEEVKKVLDYLFHEGEVFELCTIRPASPNSDLWEGKAYGAKGIVAGWFNDHRAAAMQAVMLDEDGPEGIYVSMNPCNRALLGRADNRLIANVTRTTDADIPILRHQLIDIDPLRPSGTSSTDDDHLMALKYTEVIRQRLAEEGWPEPLLGDSGNGGHLILALPDLPNTTENVELIKNVLLALEKRYTNHIQTSGGKSKACFMLRDVSLSIDQSVFNPSRLMKLYGTHARKGDNTAERPHRLARILSLPKEARAVPLELLQALAAELTDKTVITAPKAIKASKPGFDVESYLKDHGRKIKGVRSHGTSTLNLLEECVFDPSHSGGEAAIGQTEDGKLFYQCFHDSCKGRTWAEARKIISGEDKLAKYSSLPTSEARRDEPKASAGHLLPRGMTARELSTMEFPEKQWLIPGVLPKGLTVFGGRPKTGKSWMALNYALAVASGGAALGEIMATKQQVVYLALEDNARRLKQRLSSCCCGAAPPEGLTFFTEWPKLDGRGLSQLDAWLDKREGTSLVIIDTIAKLWPSAGSKQDGKTLYHLDYEFMSQIKGLADRRNIAILAIHHLRKNGSSDPVEELSGSTGISGCADTLHILQRARGAFSATLCITGRDVEEQQLALEFDRSLTTWRLLGKADEVAKTRERQEILDVLKDAPPEGMKPVQIAKVLKKPDVNVRKLLLKLAKEGQVTVKGYGVYLLNTSHTDHSGPEDHTDPTGHSDHTAAKPLPLGTGVIVH